MPMKTKIPLLILALSLYAAQSANADLIFTFSSDGAGNTAITVSGDTATAGGSGATAERDDIGFSAQGVGSVRQTGFSTRNDGFPYATFASLGSGTLSDTISLTSTGITGGSPTLINGFQFDSLNFYPLVMDGLANNTDTLSFAGSPDVTGAIAVDYSAFSSLHGDSWNAANDDWTFEFTPAIPEPSSVAFFGLGLSLLFLRRRRC